MPSPRRTATIRLAGPALLLSYGLLRWVDGRDGSHGSEPWWTVGHLAFLGAVVALVAVVAAVRRVARHRGPATAALGLAAVGAAGMLVDDRVVLVFVSGVVGSLVVLAWSRQVSKLEPLLALVGFATIIADLDLLPLGAVLLGAALAQAPAGAEIAATAPRSRVPPSQG